MNRRTSLLSAGACLLLAGCLSVKTEPIEVKPIHITIDVNVKVDKALDDFFGDLDKKSSTLATPATAIPNPDSHENFLFPSFSFVAVLALVVAAPSLRAQDLGAVKARIAQRLPEIDGLKAKGAVGENNRGFVEARGGDAGAASVVSAENSDREAVYAAIAKQQGASADQVGRTRAKKIAAGSAPGVWVQHETARGIKNNRV